VNDYPCDACGYEGPHTVIEDHAKDHMVLECGNCYAEIVVGTV